MATNPNPPTSKQNISSAIINALVCIGLSLVALSSKGTSRWVWGGIAIFIGLALVGHLMDVLRWKARQRRIQAKNMSVAKAQSKPIPTRVFEGHIKCHRAEQRDALGDLALYLGFPAFNGVNIPGGVATEPEPADPHREVFEKVMREEGVEMVELPTHGALRRRYAGDIGGSVHTLERRRYYTVCSQPSGKDGYTLANEINAYADPRALGGFVLAMDLAYANPICQETIQELAILFGDIDGMPSEIVRQAREQGLMPPDKTRGFVRLPYTVSEVRMENVLDLRYPDAQEWLVEKFGGGDPELVTCVGPKLSKADGFCALLPTLMAENNGGTSFTDAIGSFLRNSGVNALIFPSARSNVWTQFEHGRLVHWEGWNLVDYRDAAMQANPVKLLKPDDWERFIDPQQQIAKAAPDATNAGSFRIQGNAEHFRLQRHMMLCIRIWEKKGFDTDVRAYRWHATKSFKQDNKTIFVATCCSCAHQLTTPYLYGFPERCPNCSSDALVLP